jgi:hypothetical protein
VNSGWLVWIEDQVNTTLRLLERLAEAAERIADASEEAANNHRNTEPE